MKLLALMMFLASTSAFSAYHFPYEKLPDDLVESASPACKKVASAVLDCEAKSRVVEFFIPGRRLSPPHRLTTRPIKPLACPRSMNHYLLCEISGLMQRARGDLDF